MRPRPVGRAGESDALVLTSRLNHGRETVRGNCRAVQIAVDGLQPHRR
jgi:hypothetical protein